MRRRHNARMRHPSLTIFEGRTADRNPRAMAGARLLGPNDLDHALRNFILGQIGAAIPTGPLFKIHFETCDGAPAPVNGNFTCTVLEAADPNGTPISTAGITCAASVP